MEKCPVCGGRGFVPASFYESSEQEWHTYSAATVPCRSCFGRGYIIVCNCPMYVVPKTTDDKT